MNLFSADPVLALQNYSIAPALWKAISFLGNEEFFLLLMPFVYWCIDARLGLRLGLLVLLGDALNVVFKVLCALPRPYWIDARVEPLSVDTTFGLPSSHAQNAAAVWMFFAGRVRKSWGYVAALLLIVFICLSRVALGVHYPIDVLAGVAIGILFLAAFRKWEPPASAWFERQSLPIQIATSTLLALTILAAWWLAKTISMPGAYFSTLPNASAAYSWEPIVSRVGALWGLGCGAALAQRRARFEVKGPMARRWLCFFVGAVGIALCWKGLATVFPREPEALGLGLRFVRYAVLTLWVIVGAPLLFLRFGWMSMRDGSEPIAIQDKKER